MKNGLQGSSSASSSFKAEGINRPGDESGLIPFRPAKWTTYGRWSQDGRQVINNRGEVIFSLRPAAERSNDTSSPVEASLSRGAILPKDASDVKRYLAALASSSYEIPVLR